MLGGGLQSTLLGLRATLDGFPATVTGRHHVVLLRPDTCWAPRRPRACCGRSDPSGCSPLSRPSPRPVFWVQASFRTARHLGPDAFDFRSVLRGHLCRRGELAQRPRYPGESWPAACALHVGFVRRARRCAISCCSWPISRHTDAVHVGVGVDLAVNGADSALPRQRVPEPAVPKKGALSRAVSQLAARRRGGFDIGCDLGDFLLDGAGVCTSEWLGKYRHRHVHGR